MWKRVVILLCAKPVSLKSLLTHPRPSLEACVLLILQIDFVMLLLLNSSASLSNQPMLSLCLLQNRLKEYFLQCINLIFTYF